MDLPGRQIAWPTVGGGPGGPPWVAGRVAHRGWRAGWPTAGGGPKWPTANDGPGGQLRSAGRVACRERRAGWAVTEWGHSPRGLRPGRSSLRHRPRRTSNQSTRAPAKTLVASRFETLPLVTAILRRGPPNTRPGASPSPARHQQPLPTLPRPSHPALLAPCPVPCAAPSAVPSVAPSAARSARCSVRALLGPRAAPAPVPRQFCPRTTDAGTRVMSQDIGDSSVSGHR